MLNITTTDLGNGKVIAKGHGRQRTAVVLAKSSEVAHAKMVGALLNILCDDRQQAMLRHPSGGQRVRQTVDETAPGVFVTRWSVNV